MNVVVCQPMFFPWIGIFEQIRIADVFIHFDDVQIPRGRSFVSRVQIKGPSGSQWLTAPIRRSSSSSVICDVSFDNGTDWRSNHLRTLERCYSKAPFAGEMLALAGRAYSFGGDLVADFNTHAIELIAGYFGLEVRFFRSKDYPTQTKSSEHLLYLVHKFDGLYYITGHGAKAYLDHEMFEKRGIQVRYMNYRRTAYTQQFGSFEPHVSILDVIANCGRGGKKLIKSESIHWKEFINGHKQAV
jgi:hypothetical protein